MRRGATFSRLLAHAVGLILSVTLVAGCGEKAPPFNSLDITGSPGFGTDFRLTDHFGKPRTLTDFRGKVVAVFFGFTQCPDVCPTTLSDMSRVMKQLGPSNERVQVLFVTVDPKRDTEALLSQYVPAFHPTFLGLRGDAEAIAKVARDFRIIYREVPGKTADTYTVDHTAGTLIFDPQGRLRLFVPYGMDAEKIGADIKRLL
jgi:protein SCO1/2